MIHYQMTGAVIAGHLKCLTLHPWPLCGVSSHVCTEFLELFP